MQRRTEVGEDIDETRLATGDNCSSQMMKVHDNLPASQCITDIFPKKKCLKENKEGKEKVKIVRKKPQNRRNLQHKNKSVATK